MAMTKVEYAMAQGQLFMLAALARGIDAKGMLEAINRTETVGPMVDPTLWIKGHAKMGEVKKIVEGLLAFQASLPTIADAADLHAMADKALANAGT